MSKAHAIEELHSRLKTNVESIQQLNQQVKTLQSTVIRRYFVIVQNQRNHSERN